VGRDGGRYRWRAPGQGDRQGSRASAGHCGDLVVVLACPHTIAVVGRDDVFDALAAAFSTGKVEAARGLFSADYLDHQRPEGSDLTGPDEFTAVVAGARHSLGELAVRVASAVTWADDLCVAAPSAGARRSAAATPWLRTAGIDGQAWVLLVTAGMTDNGCLPSPRSQLINWLTERLSSCCSSCPCRRIYCQAAKADVVGGASEGLGQLAALLSSAGGEVVLVASDFPSVTYPWLAAHDRLGMRIRWVRDTRPATSRSRRAMPSANAPRWCASARFNSPQAARSMSRPWRRAQPTVTRTAITNRRSVLSVSLTPGHRTRYITGRSGAS
jgi:hypothetical protein